MGKGGCTAAMSWSPAQAAADSNYLISETQSCVCCLFVITAWSLLKTWIGGCTAWNRKWWDHSLKWQVHCCFSKRCKWHHWTRQTNSTFNDSNCSDCARSFNINPCCAHNARRHAEPASLGSVCGPRVGVGVCCKEYIQHVLNGHSAILCVWKWGDEAMIFSCGRPVNIPNQFGKSIWNSWCCCLWLPGTSWLGCGGHVWHTTHPVKVYWVCHPLNLGNGSSCDALYGTY